MKTVIAIILACIAIGVIVCAVLALAALATEHPVIGGIVFFGTLVALVATAIRTIL